MELEKAVDRALYEANAYLLAARPLDALGAARDAQLQLEAAGVDQPRRMAVALRLESAGWCDTDDLANAIRVASHAIEYADRSGSAPAQIESRFARARAIEAAGNFRDAFLRYEGLLKSKPGDARFIARQVACEIKMDMDGVWGRYAVYSVDPIRDSERKEWGALLARWQSLAAARDSNFDEAELLLEQSFEADTSRRAGITTLLARAHLQAHRQDFRRSFDTFTDGASQAALAGMRRHVRVAFDSWQRLMPPS